MLNLSQLKATRERLESALLYGVLPIMSHHKALRIVRGGFKLQSRASQRIEEAQRDLYHRCRVAHEVDLAALDGALADLEALMRDAARSGGVDE